LTKHLTRRRVLWGVLALFLLYALSFVLLGHGSGG
jgi:hypothetical protein